MRKFRRDIGFPAGRWRAPLEIDVSRLERLAQAARDKGEAEATPEGLAWLERAHRLAPKDQNLAFSLAWRRLQAGDAAGAAALFSELARRFGTRECWAGAAAAYLQRGERDAARAAVGAALSRTAANETLVALAQQIGAVPGWCGVTDGLRLVSDLAWETLRVELDGQVIALGGGGQLPVAARLGQALVVRRGAAELIGSPIQIGSIFRLEGCVARRGRMVTGWAWHPDAPELDPALRVQIGAKAAEIIRATEPDEQVGLQRPLARPRRFSFSAPPRARVLVEGVGGQAVYGSPLVAGAVPDKAGAPPQSVGKGLRGLPIDIVIPVHRGVAATLACIDSVVRHLGDGQRVVVVRDGVGEAALRDGLAARAGDVVLLESGADGVARGYPAACNVGLRHALGERGAGRHVVLLNSDTLVGPGWVEGLRDAACSAPDIGTATPLSNNASIFSYPTPRAANPVPDLAQTARLGAMAAAVNGGLLVDVPTAHGFCMFIRADCLAATGLFDSALFAQGYGEENDFSERARAAGWRHVAVPGVFVAHLGGASFNEAGASLLRRNLALLEARHPDYRARVAAFIAADPLAPARRRLDAARWRAAISLPGSVLLVTHGGGGGTTRMVAERAAAILAQGWQPVVLRAVDGLCEVGLPGESFPNLQFALPEEFSELAALLRQVGPQRAEIHHLLGHDHSVMRLSAQLGIPYDVWVHDYSWLCARLSFVTGEGRFCGEAAPAVCEGCVAQWGRELEDPVAPAALRRRSAADFRGAARVVTPSGDVARRTARHVDGVKPVIQPWEADPAPMAARARARGGALRVLVVGGIGLEKGFEVLLACARDAAARDLALEFRLVGYSVRDEDLLATGRVFITGGFVADEVGGLIAAQGAQMAFLPSVWPETWCFALSDIWQAGLSAAVFDIGTPAERVRAVGRGWILPLGLPPPAINDALLAISNS